MTVQSKPVRPRAPAPRRRATRTLPSPARRRSDAEGATVAPARFSAPPAKSPEIVQPPSRAAADGLSRGDFLFLVFFAAAMIMVVAVVLVGAVGQMWVLVPVMVVDLTVTFAVIATVVSLLGDDGGPSA